MTLPSSPRTKRRYKWILALVSVVVALVLAEVLLRIALFHTSVELAAKDPEYYAKSLDELWIYRHLFSASKRWTVGARRPEAAGETTIEFYKNWAASLVPDPELGYVREPNVAIPCHETTNLGTRGTRAYSQSGRKIVFLGDSFVESAACSSDTLTTKIESLTGIDTLNYGIGGYGVDQIFLYFERVAPTYNRKDCLILIGLIEDDLGRMLLAVRTSPKPFFTLRDGRLVLHTSHIHPEALNDFYQQPPERSYLYYFIRGRLGFPIYRSLMNQTRELRQNVVHAISQAMFKTMAEQQRAGQFALAFVIFPTPGNPFDPGVISLLRAEKIPVIDLQQGCLEGRPDTELYAELHPTSLGNDLLASCLVKDLTAMKLLPLSE